MWGGHWRRLRQLSFMNTTFHYFLSIQISSMTALPVPKITWYHLLNIIQNEANVNHQCYKPTNSSLNCTILSHHIEKIGTETWRSFGTSFHLKKTAYTYRLQTNRLQKHTGVQSSILNTVQGSPWMNGTPRKETWACSRTKFIYLEKHPALHLAHNCQMIRTC